MPGFTLSFLTFFEQIAWGGLFALSATPFHELDRAFYKSTAGVLLVIAALALWGKSGFYWADIVRGFSFTTAAEALVHVIFVLCFTAYVISLWGENQRFRARSFASATLTGFIALMLGTHEFYAAPALSVETVVYLISFFISALLLGSVTVGMLIGHWYLIDTGQSLDPFVRIFRFFVIALLTQAVFFWVSTLLLSFFGSGQTVASLQRLWHAHATLVAIRVLAGQIGPLILAWMIWRTLLIPHTMAATGLFYIALLGVFVGEILGRQILALSSLPL